MTPWTFRHSREITFPKLRQQNLETGRVYLVESGEYAGLTFPSITRVLGAKPKPALDAWKKRVGAKEAARVSRAATTQGTAIHKLAEMFLNNRISVNGLPPNVAELWSFLRPWLLDHVTCVYEQETDVFSPMLSVAGRFDLLAEIDNILTVVDFKTAARPKREAYIEDYYLQGTFYAAATYELTGHKPKRIIFPIVSPQGLQLFETKPSNHISGLVDRVREYYTLYHPNNTIDGERRPAYN